MKHHQTKGAIALETREQLARELDKLLDKDIHNIQDRDRWLLDLQQSDVGEMSLRQLQYSVFTLRAANTLDNVVIQRTGGKTKDFAAHVKMEGIEVPHTEALLCSTKTNLCSTKACLQTKAKL